MFAIKRQIKAVLVVSLILKEQKIE